MKFSFFLFILSVSIFITSMVNAVIYMQCQGETDMGISWSGECDMYSNKNGNLIYSETDNGKKINGKCYKYSPNYAGVEYAKTEDGIVVSGECLL